MRRPSTTRKTTTSVLACLAAVGLTAACGGGSGFDGEDSGGGDATGDGSLTVLIGSSGDAETDAVTAAVDAWATDNGVEAEVLAAQDLAQELTQGFTGGDPPDVFYVPSDLFAGYAENGSLLPYASDLENAGDFYPALQEAFTFEDEFYCAPKDISTLGLVINNAAWTAAGLTEADVPTTWEELQQVAQQLTTGGQTGLVIGGEYPRVGAFMAQAGGGLVEDGAAVADSPENVEALQYVSSLLTEGSMAYAADVGAGWGGEAFGTQTAAMTIEGNWITGAMAADYPDVDYLVAPLPAGPGGEATLSFTTCWGIAADSGDPEAAQELVSYLTAPEQQASFATAFGVMPSVESAADAYREEFPQLTAFLDQVETAQNVPNQVGVNDVLADLTAQLEGLPEADPQQILSTTQANLEAVLGPE